MREIEKAKIIEMRGLMIWSMAAIILSPMGFYATLEFATKQLHSSNIVLLEATCVTVFFLMAFSAFAVIGSMNVGLIPTLIAIIAVVMAAFVNALGAINMASINDKAVVMLAGPVMVVAIIAGIIIFIRRTLPQMTNCKQKVLKVIGVQALVIFAIITAIINFH